MNRSFFRGRRLRKTSEFRVLYRKGRCAEELGLRIYLGLNGGKVEGRLGTVIPKRCCRKAVQRNRIRRCIREWFRRSSEIVLRKNDCVVKVLREEGWAQAPALELAQCLDRILGRFPQ
ncbi:MAG: ribonuclease P protein component [Puniceicoccales bacterium]|nr:ribonuclease P protein component [Puniceicoccales bacterium]